MADYTVELQKVIYQRIVDAAISGVVHVIDHRLNNPSDGDFPYIQIGNEQALPADVVGSDGAERFIDLHVWSRKRGQSQVKGIQGDLRVLFHAQSLSVAGLKTAFSYVDATRILDDPDGLTRHGITVLKIICHE